MKTRTLKTLLIAAAAATLALASSMVACAKEGDIVPPRVKSNCDLMGCSGQHISVKDPASGLDLYFCVPQNLTYSVDEYQQKVAAYLADKAENKVVVEEEPVVEVVVVDESDYFAPPRVKSSCDLMGCSGQHISVKDPARGLDLYFCVPQNLTYSVDEYQQKVAAYLAEKAGIVTEEAVVEEAPAEEVVAEEAPAEGVVVEEVVVEEAPAEAAE